jgi:hypothetical protein
MSRGEDNFTSGKSFEEKQLDLGFFHYTENGFTYSNEDFKKTLKWDDIDELNAYVFRPGGPFEEIALEVVYNGRQFTITEAIPGWHQFVSRTKDVFSTIPKDWDWEIWEPSSQTNYRNIYQKYDEEK